jgi:dephospho-CoA kinase
LTVVAVAGRIGAGKSTVAKEIARIIGGTVVSFGSAVRAEAEKQDLPCDRTTLQRLGDELIREGWDHFCDLVLEQAHAGATASLVVDGVRHLGAIDSLSRRSAPQRVVVVFVDSSWSTRCRRVASRGVAEDDLAQADNDPNEREVEAVRERSDLLVVNDGDLKEAVRNLIVGLERHDVLVANKPE